MFERIALFQYVLWDGFSVLGLGRLVNNPSWTENGIPLYKSLVPFHAVVHRPVGLHHAVKENQFHNTCYLDCTISVEMDLRSFDFDSASIIPFHIVFGSVSKVLDYTSSISWNTFLFFIFFGHYVA
jgi:hypothetical protein